MKNIKHYLWGFIPAFILFIGCYQSRAQSTIEVSGDITENTTWSDDTIKITGNVTINDDVTLTIEPGTFVKFQGYYWLSIKGTILAEGTQQEWITFTVQDTTGYSDTDTILGSWYGIQFDNSPTGANGKMFDNDTSVFSYCIIEYGKRSPDSGDKYFYSLIYIHNYSKIKFKNNWIRHCTAMGSIFKCYFASPEFRSNRINDCNSGEMIQLIELGNSLIIGNQMSNNRGRGIAASFSSPYIINNIITNNSSNYWGGGIQIIQSNPVLINNTICNNVGTKGGALYVSGSEPLLYNNIIWGNTGSDGNQIYLADANLSPDIYHCAIQGGTTEFGGLAFSGKYIQNVESDPLFQESSGGAGVEYDGLSPNWSLEPNSPCLNSGLSDETLPYHPESDFLGNPRIKFGETDMGAIEYSLDVISASGSINSDAIWLSDTVKVNDNIVIENGVTLSIPPGVIVEWQGMYSMTVIGTLIAEGKATEYITFTVSDTSYFSCKDSIRGGWRGIKFSQTPETNDSSKLRYCIFEYGKESTIPYSGGYGGAMYVDKFSKLSILNCIFRNCMAERGGAIWLSNSNIDIKNSLISQNYATLYGGGIALSYSNSTLENNEISNNKCDLYGGGMYIGGKPALPTIINCLVYNNFGSYGGGISCHTNALFINTTISNNTANSGGGILLYSCKPMIYNSIFWSNYRGMSLNQLESWFQASPFIYNCDIQNGLAGIDGMGEGVYQDNIELNPSFQFPTKSAGPGYYNDSTDWTISDFSPCIDKGKLLENIPETDFLGNSRVNNLKIDIGAVENQGSLLLFLKHPLGKVKCEGESVSFTVEVSDTAYIQWGKDGIVLPGETQKVLRIDSVTMNHQGNYTCMISNSYGDIESNPAFLLVNEKPTFLSDPPNTWTEQYKPVSLKAYAKGSNLTYKWQKDGIDKVGAYTSELIILNADYTDEGEYRCIISSSCGHDTTTPAILYVAPQICMVTVSTLTGNNLVVWEKISKAPLLDYNIYRESKASGIYDLMGIVSYDDLSIFVDTTADPMVQAYIYKITGIDTAGIETDIDLCKPHKTIHLLVSTNPELNTTQLSWDKYYGFDYQTYNIYRSATGSEFEIRHSMASSLNSWTDPDPVADVGYYRIAVEKPVPWCMPTGGSKKAESGPYSHSMSNIEDNRLQEVQENQAPTDINLTSNTIAENQSVGTMVGRLETTDADTTDHHTYKLVSGSGDQDNNRFTTLGDLLITAEMLDYETKDTLFIRAQSTDKGDLSVEGSFVILVTDINEGAGNLAPTDITLSFNSIDENKPFGTLIGRFQTQDPNDEDMHTYGLVEGLGGDDNNSFAVLADMLISATEFDYETKSEYMIRLRSRDDGDGRLSFEKSFTIYINDLNEVGIIDNRIENNGLEIYPNPFSNKTVIQFKNPACERYRMYITDLAGKVVYFEDNIYTSRIEFSREGLPDGYYFVELRGPGIYRGKIVLE